MCFGNTVCISKRVKNLTPCESEVVKLLSQSLHFISVISQSENSCRNVTLTITPQTTNQPFVWRLTEHNMLKVRASVRLFSVKHKLYLSIIPENWSIKCESESHMRAQTKAVHDLLQLNSDT